MLIVDVLYCEQEVKADDTPAIEAVLSADIKMSELKRERDFVFKRMEKDLTVEQTEELTTRMGEIDNELNAMGEDSAEPRARRILSGLGFTERMQSRATKGKYAFSTH